MIRELFTVLLVFLIITIGCCDETTQHYLQNAIRSLRRMKTNPNIKRIDTHISSEPKSTYGRSHEFSDDAPPLTLTKGELAALYQEAVRKGDTLKLDTGDSEYIQAAVHHLDGEESVKEPSYFLSNNDQHSEIPTEDSGYYYYYYPLKSFFDKLQPTEASHNITISTEATRKEAKPIEPLFMAISGFIGMAVMALVSMIIVPKFGIKGKIKPPTNKEKLDDLTKLAIRAIEGQCAERFACELTKTARSFSIEENRFYKLLKRIAPGTFGKYISNSEKYANKHLKCTAIPCAKRKVPSTKKPPTAQKKKTAVNKKH
ncbi:uncharacterized protein LOC143197742 isoform X2 [Rhynchophorus ferrugineus]|uniref:uncharacterized protein LOC143197742 isoform X2 n=1 Tax=Rhynchophorus ferrugineus TaxID=354439 RepID=UPI003FCDB8EA